MRHPPGGWRRSARVVGNRLRYTYTAGTPRYYVNNESPLVPAGGSASLSIMALAGGDIASPSQKGLLLMYRDAREQRQADAIFVTP